jgi:hypothetical protein
MLPDQLIKHPVSANEGAEFPCQFPSPRNLVPPIIVTAELGGSSGMGGGQGSARPSKITHKSEFSVTPYYFHRKGHKTKISAGHRNNEKHSQPREGLTDTLRECRQWKTASL